MITIDFSRSAFSCCWEELCPYQHVTAPGKNGETNNDEHVRRTTSPFAAIDGEGLGQARPEGS